MSCIPAAPPRTGPIRLGAAARTALRPTVKPVLNGGFWGIWQQVNAGVSIPRSPELLGSAGNPPNVMRLLASLEHYLTSPDGRGIQPHQHAGGACRAGTFFGPLIVTVHIDYPWYGRNTITIGGTPVGQPWTLSPRIPQRCTEFTARSPERADNETTALPHDGWPRLTRAWTPGDRVVPELGPESRLSWPDPRIDAARGGAAIERGPLVYSGYRRATPADDWSPKSWRCADNGWADGADRAHTHGAEPAAIPYDAWANRRGGAMRVRMPAS